MKMYLMIYSTVFYRFIIHMEDTIFHFETSQSLSIPDFLADRTHSWYCIYYCKLLGPTILQPSGGMLSISEIYFGILTSVSNSHSKIYLNDWTCSWVALFIANMDAKPFNNLIYTSWIYQIVFTKQQLVLMKSTQIDLGMTHVVCNSIKILLCNNPVNNKIY